jgi:release factor glutamine methyltransferase
LDVFRRILDVAPLLLAPQGWMCVELSEDNVELAAGLCRARGCWTHVEVRQDLTGRPRVLRAILQG